MARKRTAVVPRAVLGASFGSVIPACVALGIQACSNGNPLPGVAAVAYCCFDASLGDGDAADSTTNDAPSDVTTEAEAEGGDAAKD